VPERYRQGLLTEAIERHWDLAQIRTAIRQRRFGPNRSRSRRPPGLTRRVHDFRLELRDVQPEDLSEADRRELRLLFEELALLARARPRADRRPIFPPLPA
jgi:hypothetical protein